MTKHHTPSVQWAIKNIFADGSFTKKIKILDIGCGAGTGINIFNKNFKNARFYGIDYSKDMVELTKETHKELIKNNRLEVHHASVDKLPFDDNMFQLVIGIETSHFWLDKKEGLAEIKRVLEINGLIVLVNEVYMYPDYERFLPKLQVNAVKLDKVKVYTEKQYKEILQEAGFQDIKIHTCPDKGWISIVAKKPE